MSSTFLGLNTAYTGLQASNAALNTTANNVANVETEGYSRQKVSTKAADAIRTYTTYGCVGSGVETTGIDRVRDAFYDQKYWNNESKLGEYEVKAYYMSSLENYYKDDDTINGFTTIFDKFSDTVSELTKNPSDITYRQQTIGRAGDLTTYFSDMYANLKKIQDDVNQEIKVNVERINSISQEIASLNQQINVIEMNTGASANELRDQRDLLVDELSEIIQVDVREEEVIDSRDVSRDTGGTRYIVSICGQTLVDASEFRTLTCVTKELNVKNNQTDIDGLYELYFYGESDWTVDDYRRKGDVLAVNGTSSSGKLSGLLQMRDGNNGEYFHGTVKELGSTSWTDENGDPHTGQTVKIEVTDPYLMDLDKCNLSQSGGIIQIDHQNYYYCDWSYTQEEGSDSGYYTIVLDNSRNSGTVSAGAIQSTTTIGEAVNYQGIPYYMSQMNEWVRNYAAAANDITQSGTLADGSFGAALFTGSHIVTGEDMTFDKSDRLVTVSEDGTAVCNEYTITDKTGMIMTTGMDGSMTYQLAAGMKLTDVYGEEWTILSVASDGVATVENSDGTTNKSLIFQGDDGTGILDRNRNYYLLTAGNFKVREELEEDASLLATSSELPGTSDGVEKKNIIEDLVKLRTDTSRMSFRGSSADQFLVNILGDVSMNAQRANNFEANYTYIGNTIQNQRLSISGVDNDEEALNLSKYQQQYNLASKMIQVLTEIYDRLILQTGV